MAYQFKREPLTPEEADKLYQACNNIQEKLIIWILLDTGLIPFVINNAIN